MNSIKQDNMKEARWFLTALLFLLITLKLAGHIASSWWWVLAPFWIPLVVALSLMTLYAIMLAYGLKKGYKK